LKTLFSLAAGLLFGWSLSLAFAVSAVTAVLVFFTGNPVAFLIAAVICASAYVLEWMMNNTDFGPSQKLMSFLERRFTTMFNHVVKRQNREFIDRSVRSEHKRNGDPSQ
jgi:uncharacterized membrane protein YczE